jgi:energy-coupling factor transporter ATP-binding protein EcfA2
MNRSGLEVAGLAVHSLAELGFLDRLRSIFKKRHTLLVVGCSGTGKTNLLSSLRERLPKAVGISSRTKRSEITSVTIAGQIFKFVDTPGELSAARTDLMRHLAQENPDYIINVVSYGYHEYLAETSEVFDQAGRVRQSYLEMHRQREVDMLQEWVPFVDLSHNTKLLTVVTKADLWWSDRERVFAYYLDGAYAEALGRLKSAQVAVLGFSAVWKRFYDIAPTDPNFDQHEALNLRANLLALLFNQVADNSSVPQHGWRAMLSNPLLLRLASIVLVSGAIISWYGNDRSIHNEQDRLHNEQERLDKSIAETRERLDKLTVETQERLDLLVRRRVTLEQLDLFVAEIEYRITFCGLLATKSKGDFQKDFKNPNWVRKCTLFIDNRADPGPGYQTDPGPGNPAFRETQFLKLVQEYCDLFARFSPKDRDTLVGLGQDATRAYGEIQSHNRTRVDNKPVVVPDELILAAQFLQRLPETLKKKRRELD